MARRSSLVANGYDVSVIAPSTETSPSEGRRRRARPRATARTSRRDRRAARATQVAEYLVALAKTLRLMAAPGRSPGFDVIQACNPPDLFFLVAWPFKLAGKRFIFDQHDLSPELYATLFGRDAGPIMTALRWTERLSYRLADAVIATNESYRSVALTRGRRRRPTGCSSSATARARAGPLPWSPTRPSRRAARCWWSTWASWATRTASTCCWRPSTRWCTRSGFRDATFALVGDGNAEQDLMRRRRGSWASRSTSTSSAGSRTRSSCPATSTTADACVCPETVESPERPVDLHQGDGVHGLGHAGRGLRPARDEGLGGRRRRLCRRRATSRASRHGSRRC